MVVEVDVVVATDDVTEVDELSVVVDILFVSDAAHDKPKRDKQKGRR